MSDYETPNEERLSTIRAFLEGLPEKEPDGKIHIPPGGIRVSWPIAAYKHTRGEHTDAHITTYNWVSDSVDCSERNMLDVAGTGRTGADGKAVISLNAAHCVEPKKGEDLGLIYQYPVNVVATARSSTPFHLAIGTRIGPGADGRQDVAITVLSWDVNGDPAASVAFDWRCMAPYKVRQVD